MVFFLYSNWTYLKFSFSKFFFYFKVISTGCSISNFSKSCDMTQWCKKPIDSSEIFSSSKLLRNTNSKSCKISIEKPCSATEMKVVAKMCVSSSLLQKPNWLVVQISYFYAILALSKLSFSAFCQCYIQCCHKIWLLLWNYELDADMSEMEPLIGFCFVLESFY